MFLVVLSEHTLIYTHKLADSEDGSDMYLRNVGNTAHIHTV
jgi:hypothetical protein